METRICTGKCGLEKNINQFYKNRYYCISCISNYKNEYYNTLHGAMRVLLGTAKATAKKRSKIPGREQAGIFEISFEDIKNLWKNQKGLCYYSYIPMNYDKHEWKISLERKNTTLGYINSNIVLCCKEFNQRLTWSHAKIQEMLNILNQNIKNNVVNFDIKNTVQVKKIISETIINDIKYCNCIKCDKILPKDQFYTSRLTYGCKECHALKNKLFRDSPRGCLLELICTAKTTTKTRQTKKHGNHDKSFDIDYDFLVETFNQQNGLCAYSRLPLQFGNSKEINWVISLERKNTLKGYIKSNICLICLEFQASDFSIIQSKNNKDSSNGGWSKEKFKYFMQHITKTKSNKNNEIIVKINELIEKLKNLKAELEE